MMMMYTTERDHLTIMKEALGAYGFSRLISLALRFFVRNAYESLVITDKEGRIRFMDRGSEKLFGLGKGEASGLEIEALLPDTALPKVIETGYPSIGRVLNVKGVKKIGSSYPLIKDGEVIGAIGRVLFHSLEEVERINDKMKMLRREVRTLRQRSQSEYSAAYTFQNILGKSPGIKNCIAMSKKIAIVQSDVLISGESGTGKELFAQAIHNFSGSDRPFVRVNCPAIPFELAESELFGYEKGAFSGADREGRKGKFEAAENGTVFLDEINSLPLSIQGKLLRVIQEREVEKVGSTRTKKLDIRIIAATNTDLKKAVSAGSFREDLYYRIARTSIHIPPLRERKEDIAIYAEHFLVSINRRFGTHFNKISDDALACLKQYSWPGNIRALINVLEQACLREWEGDEIPLSALPDDLTSDYRRDEPVRGNRLRTTLEKQEMELIIQTLNRVKGNKRQAAVLLGIPRSSLYNKLNFYGKLKD
jgi:transcriptional regulator with PAS, ATPase and Fis domain